MILVISKSEISHKIISIISTGDAFFLSFFLSFFFFFFCNKIMMGISMRKTSGKGLSMIIVLSVESKRHK